MKKRQKPIKEKLKVRIKKYILNFTFGAVIILPITYILNPNIRETINNKIIFEANKDIKSNMTNLKIDKEAFAENMTQDTSLQYLTLINKNNKVSSEYEPNDLVIPSIKFGSIGDMMVQYVRRDVAIALEGLFKEAKNEGINLVAISGYRSYEYQKNLYDNEVANVGEIQANRYVAKPGQSEHQLGLAMDILSDEYMILDEVFEETNAFRWLESNMSKFGFILRYPKGKEDITGYGYEPWHIRYVGIAVATEVMNNGITLEEFLD